MCNVQRFADVHVSVLIIQDNGPASALRRDEAAAQGNGERIEKIDGYSFVFYFFCSNK